MWVASVHLHPPYNADNSPGLFGMGKLMCSSFAVCCVECVQCVGSMQSVQNGWSLSNIVVKSKQCPHTYAGSNLSAGGTPLSRRFSPYNVHCLVHSVHTVTTNQLTATVHTPSNTAAHHAHTTHPTLDTLQTSPHLHHTVDRNQSPAHCLHFASGTQHTYTWHSCPTFF